MLDRQQIDEWWFEKLEDPPEPVEHTELDDVRDITQGPKKPQLHPEY